MIVHRTARKKHPCAFGSHSINPGDHYVDEVLAPWTMIGDDLDDEGRTVYSRHDRWDHVRYHMSCRMEGW